MAMLFAFFYQKINLAMVAAFDLYGFRRFNQSHSTHNVILRRESLGRLLR
jgi:hypothetical protein